MGGLGKAGHRRSGLALAGKARRMQARRRPRQPQGASAQRGCQGRIGAASGQQAPRPDRPLPRRRFANGAATGGGPGLTLG
jgi:hypothetical protein